VSKQVSKGFAFEIKHSAENGLARVGTISTPHGDIQTPAFIPVGTKATVKSVLPEAMKDLGSQALLANAYHLYLQPGPDLLDEAGGLAKFMNWNGPTFTDSGGFQVLSLGVGFKKVLAMDAKTFRSDQVIAGNKERLAHVDDDGVTFKSHLDGSMHRFTAEISMQIQHKIGADIIFAFDECTTLHNTRPYQELAMERTYDWAIRCLDEHKRLTEQRSEKICERKRPEISERCHLLELNSMALESVAHSIKIHSAQSLAGSIARCRKINLSTYLGLVHRKIYLLE
jgi:queuine tRNA-ribosyltransferase